VRRLDQVAGREPALKTHEKAGTATLPSPGLKAVLLLLAIAFILGGCSLTREVVNALKSTDRFVPYKGDSRILYEPGAEAFAAEVTGILNTAIKTVEDRHYRGFANDVSVHLCASKESFVHYMGQNVRGKVAYKGLFLSPRLMEEPGSILPLLTHELSHLHIKQQLGTWRISALPFWLSEGIATYVSDGGGAENVSPEEAAMAIKEGRHFLPHEDGGIIFRKTPSHWSLEPHMYYRQSMMFISYLKNIDEEAFRATLLNIQDGRKFRGLMKQTYGKSPELLWTDFMESI